MTYRTTASACHGHFYGPSMAFQKIHQLHKYDTLKAELRVTVNSIRLVHRVCPPIFRSKSSYPQKKNIVVGMINTISDDVTHHEHLVCSFF